MNQPGPTRNQYNPRSERPEQPTPCPDQRTHQNQQRSQPDQRNEGPTRAGTSRVNASSENVNADFLAKTVGDCYTVDVTFQDVEVSCLLDPVSQVTTVSEGFYREHLEPRGLVLKEIPSPFTLVSANGSNIPYIGCFETDIKVLGEIVRERVVLVLVDSAERKEPDSVQGILGMNVLQEYWERIEPPGQGYLTRLIQPISKQAWQKTMKFMSDRSKLGDEGGRVDKAYLSGGSVVISARQSVIIEGQIPAVKFGVVLEPDRDGAIPRGVIVPPCFVEVHDGKFSLAVHNEGESELVLYRISPGSVTYTLGRGVVRISLRWKPQELLVFAEYQLRQRRSMTFLYPLR